MGVNLVNASSQKLSALLPFTTTLAGSAVTLGVGSAPRPRRERLPS
jgi:hypothetical protein